MTWTLCPQQTCKTAPHSLSTPTMRMASWVYKHTGQQHQYPIEANKRMRRQGPHIWAGKPGVPSVAVEMPHLPFPCLHSHMVPAIPELISSTIMNPHKAGLTPAEKCPGSLVPFLLPTPHNRLHAVSCCQLLGLWGCQSA